MTHRGSDGFRALLASALFALAIHTSQAQQIVKPALDLTIHRPETVGFPPSV